MYIKLHHINKKSIFFINKEKQKELKKKLYDEFKKIKNDLISFDEYTSDKKYHKWIAETKKYILPKKKNLIKIIYFMTLNLILMII
jgi:spore coat polysaccharide biosynthesis predicted glycosyltransferase SpsG